MIANYGHTGAETKAHAIPGSLSHAAEIGQTIHALDERAAEPIDVLTEMFDGHHLFSGKLTDVHRRTTEGFAKGEAMIDGLGTFSEHELSIQFQNEFLIAETDDEVLATAPDLICLIETE